MPNQLDRIQSPGDLKALTIDDLMELSSEIRQVLIDVVSTTGGHLSSNLGVVELTIALHKVFNSPEDTIVFDVGHQCYTHKILTGRKELFDTLRKRGGISGFPKPSESEHDTFIVGHSSTSMSAAIGIARAKKLRGDHSKVIVVIGDGAFGGGMVYEAINTIDRHLDNLIVILNNNEMSISKSVGAMAQYLLTLRTNQGYSKFKRLSQKILMSLPLVGRRLATAVLQSKSSLRRAIYGGTLFEELGFYYVGIIDGHDISKLCRLFSSLKKIEAPILIHAVTTKGKGYSLAENNPGAYHGVGNFDVEDGNPDIELVDSYSNVFGKKLCELADVDHQICAITAAMKYATGLHFFYRHHKPRFFDVGIAEEHGVTFCAGLAKGGMKPVFSVYSTFLQRAYDQLIEDVALGKVPMLLAIDRAGLVGEDGETHQGIFDVSMLNSIGAFYTVSPSNYSELEYWLERLVKMQSPCAIRYPRGCEDELTSDLGCTGAEYDLIDMGESKDCLFVTYGRILSEVLEAAQILKIHGVSCDILKINTIIPLNQNCVDVAFSYKRIVFVEESIQQGGISETFLFLLSKAGYPGEYRIQAISERSVLQGTVLEQFQAAGLDSDNLVKLFFETRS